LAIKGSLVGIETAKSKRRGSRLNSYDTGPGGYPV
jgi:hypothetical protein